MQRNNKEDKLQSVVMLGANIPALKDRLKIDNMYKIVQNTSSMYRVDMKSTSNKEKVSRPMKFLGFAGKDGLLMLFETRNHYKTTFSWIEERLGSIQVLELSSNNK